MRWALIGLLVCSGARANADDSSFLEIVQDWAQHESASARIEGISDASLYRGPIYKDKLDHYLSDGGPVYRLDISHDAGATRLLNDLIASVEMNPEAPRAIDLRQRLRLMVDDHVVCEFYIGTLGEVSFGDEIYSPRDTTTWRDMLLGYWGRHL